MALIALISNKGWSQPKMYASKASTLEARNHFGEAARMYRGLHDRGDRESAIRAAMNLYKAHRYQEALPYFHLSDSIKLLDDVDEIFAYFECLKSVKDYMGADALVKTHVKKFAGRREFELHENKLSYYEKLASYKKIKIKPLPFNTEFSEISPTLYNQWIYFVSTRPTTNNKEIHRLNNQPFYNLYATPLKSDMKKAVMPEGEFGAAEKKISYQGFEAPSLPNGINKKHHDGPIYVAPSGKILFFTTNWSKEKRPKSKLIDINLLIYYCTKDGNTWSEPKPLPFNSFTYHNQHAFFDEKTSTLYFSSDMPNGFGSFDIWKATYTNGLWSAPVNLGPKVNTPREEVFPSIAPDGSLIISSNGWPGLGGLDLFMVFNPDEEPINLTGGLNTERDEFGLYFTGRTLAYMTSNRVGSVGDDDIYGVEIDLDDIKAFMIPADKILRLIVRDEKTGQPLDDVRISMTGNIFEEYVTPVTYQVQDTLDFREFHEDVPKITINLERSGYDPKQVVIDGWPTDQRLLDLALTMLAQKQVVSAKPPVRQIPPTPGRPNAGKTNTELANAEPEGPVVQVRALDNQKFIIYFDFDRFNIRKDAADILAKVAYVLLEEYQAAQVLLTGHTDIRGSIEYNDRLSKNRVETAKKWLIERGVSTSRIRTAYQGELNLAVFCKEAVNLERNRTFEDCLTEFEHQLNRRVEIEILNSGK